MRLGVRPTLLCLLIVATRLLLGQTTTPSQELLQKAHMTGAQWQEARQQAESLSVHWKVPVRNVTSAGIAVELQRMDDFRPTYYMTHNANSARTISTDKVWPESGFGFSLTGLGQRGAMWDAGLPRATHQEVFSKIFLRERLLPVLAHSTHVACTMIGTGNNPAARGMARLAELTAYDWNNDLSEMTASAAWGLRFSNHSYGTVTGWQYNAFGDGRWAWFGDPSISMTEDYKFGFYSSDARDMDGLAVLAPYYLIVRSAGNDRGDVGPAAADSHWVFRNPWVLENVVRTQDGGPTGFDCISPSSVAKNVLVVGAIQAIPAGYRTAGDAVMTPFSSWGPTDDGRIKPDLVADGMSVYSAVDSSDYAYGTMSGTSMASPGVCGSVALLLELRAQVTANANMLSSTLRALLIHTADEAGPAAGPDYRFGWGLMNTQRAASQISLDAEWGGNCYLREIPLSQGGSFTLPVYSDGAVPLEATVCWTDPAGEPPSASLNPATRILVNDLDLRVSDTSTVHQPWVLDPYNPALPASRGDNTRDPVEQVRIDQPHPGRHLITISHKAQLRNDQQLVSLIVSGGVFSPPGPPTPLAPGHNSQDVSISSCEFSWSPVKGAAKYRFQLSSDTSFTSLIQDTLLADTLHTSGGLQEAQHYCWRICGMNAAGPGPWTDSWHFETSRYGRLDIPCQFGWNMISSSIKPHDARLEGFSGTMPHLLLLKNINGGVFWPEFGVNTIGSWDLRQGYLAYMENADTLHLTGVLVAPQRTPIHLLTGWNMPSYLRTSPMSISEALSSIAGELLLAKDLLGQIYWPAQGIDAIGSMQPGMGYLVYVQDSTTLVYPANQETMNQWALSEDTASGIRETGRRIPNTGKNASVLVSCSELQSGDEIDFRNLAGSQIGFGKAKDGRAFATLWGYDEMGKASSTGALEGDTLILYRRGAIDGIETQLTISGLIDVLRGRESPLPLTYSTNSVYEVHAGPLVVGFNEAGGQTPTTFGLYQNYPNPFNPTTAVRFQLPIAAEVKLTLHDLLGRELVVLADERKEPGRYEVTFTGRDLPSGVYYCRMQSGSYVATRKLVLLK